jgi:gliding motility-associated-like protein
VIVDSASPCNTIQLTNLSEYCKDDLEYLWDFGDGTTSTEENPLHTFPDTDTEQTYTITLTVTSASDGQSDSMSLQFTTSTITPLFTFEENCGRLTVANTTLICGVDFTQYQNFSYDFDFGDGSPVITVDETEPVIDHVYPASGNYDVTLVMRDDNSDYEVTVMETVTVALGINADFDFIIDCFDVQFTDTSTICDPITSWVWDFGDGSPVSNEESPLHTYTTDGPFNVSLTIDDGTFTDTVTMEVALDPNATIPDFSFTSVCDEVQFTNQSNSCAVLTYSWDFGDGTTSTEENPVHVFEFETPFNVVLTVNDGIQDYSVTQELLLQNEFSYNLPPDMMACEDADNLGGTMFNLLDQSDFILADYMDTNGFFPQLSYHISLDDAENNSNAIGTQFTNTENPQQLFVRIPDSQGCFRIEQFNVETFAIPPVIQIEDVLFCSVNNTENYDLSQLNGRIFEQTQGQNFNISFHTSENDAQSNENATLSLNLVAGETQTVFIRLENAEQPSCFSISNSSIRTVSLYTSPSPRDRQKLTIYNRWGNIVFETNGYNNDWQGTFDGKTLPFGTYYYTFDFGDDTGRTKSGYISLLR